MVLMELDLVPAATWLKFGIGFSWRYSLLLRGGFEVACPGHWRLR